MSSGDKDTKEKKEKIMSELPDGTSASDFIRDIVSEDIKSDKWGGQVVTRFPPEPNGFLHIGHAKAICIDFGIAEENGGKTHLRFDDTNPMKEDSKYVQAIKDDIAWLGYSWGEREFHASDYFDKLYDLAVELINKGKAYVCDLSADEVRQYRGTPTEAGQDSPNRERTIDENLDLFARMKAGEFADGARTLRARIDMAAPNLNMRDPVMYRILKATHHRTGDKWCIYPMYDFTHCISDSIEKITHSLCDISFEDHRPLYDWFLDELNLYHPQQIEFARLNLSYTVTAKRKLRELIEAGKVADWDDPRLPTLRGMRRRGYTPNAIRRFIRRVGVSKRESVVDVALLEHMLREDLNKVARRFMGVLNPIKLVIENYPEDQTEHIKAINNPEDESAGTRQVPFSKVLYIEKDDFMEDPPRKFFRMAPGREVRLRYAYFVTCTDVVKDDQGEIVEIRCTYDPATQGGSAPDGRKVKATIHWVSAKHARQARVRLYNQLFTRENPLDESDGVAYLDTVNPESVVELDNCQVEPSLAELEEAKTFQFERQGYFCEDIKDSSPEYLVFNRTVTLRDTWARIKKGQKK